jgi:hypothetical protein
MIVSSNGIDYKFYRTQFVRVAELLDDPKDEAAIAAMFLEELGEAIGAFNRPVFVLSCEPFDFRADEEEIEYNIVVALSEDDSTQLLALGDDLDFDLEEE